MKKFLFYLLPLLLIAGFTACDKDKGKNPPDEPKPEEVTYKLSLDPKELSLYLDETATITPTLTPAADEATFTFKSDDEDVATVNAKGVVSTGGTYGSATITVRAFLGDKAIAVSKCEVEVVKDKLILSEEEVTLLKGNSVSLTANLDKTKKEVTTECEWKSSNTNIATVKDGKIEAVDKGECDITATYDGITSKCHVVVALDILLISDEELVLREGEEASLFATLQNAEEDITSNCVWETSDADVASVIEGEITAEGPGECDITATYDDQTVVCHVTVEAYLNVTPTSVKLKEGETQQLTANMDGVSYSSSNTSVATVSATGLVTANGEGETRINATCGDMIVYVDVTVMPTAHSISSLIPSAVLVLGKQNATTALSIPASLVSISPATANVATAIEGKINWNNGSTTTFTSSASGWTAQLPACGSGNLLTGTIEWSTVGAGSALLTTSQQITLLAEEALQEHDTEYFGTMGMTEDVEVNALNLPSCDAATWSQYIEPFLTLAHTTSGQGANVSVYDQSNKYTINATYLATSCGISGMRNTLVKTAVKLKVLNGASVGTKSFTQKATFYSSAKEYSVHVNRTSGSNIASSYEAFDFTNTSSVTIPVNMARGTYNAYKTEAVNVAVVVQYYTNAAGTKNSPTQILSQKSVSSLQSLYNSPVTIVYNGKSVTVQLNVN